MTNKLLFIAVLTLFFQSGNICGQGIKISGRTIDESTQPLSNCTVMLFNEVDSSLVNGVISKPDGRFVVESGLPGSYLLEISMLGFGKNVLSLTVKGENIHVGDILLKESMVSLSDIVVTASRKDVEFSPGKMTVNLSSSLSKSQGNIFDVLKIMPGVFIKEDGTVALNGQTGTKIFVNGKSTYLSGENLVNLLRSMPATSVNKVELITHPSAQYDASGNSGIINLNTDKYFFRGTNLSVHTRYTQGKYTSGNAGFNLAYRTSKICVFSDYSFYKGTGYNDLKVRRDDLDFITQEPLDKSMYQNTYRKWNYDTHYYRVGIDYDLSSKLFFGLYSNGFIMDRRQNGSINSKIMDSESVLYSELSTQNRNNKYPRSYSGGVNLAYKPTTETEWNNYFDYVYHEQPENHFQYDKYYDFFPEYSTQDTLKGDMGGDIHIYAGESNITFPVWKSKVRAGLKTSFISVGNSTVYHNFVNNEWEVNPLLSKQFSYDENINAGYIQIERSFTDNLSLQAGLRLENTNVKGNVYQQMADTDSSYSGHYTNLFPSLTVEYKLSNDNAVSILYARRINRPNYNDMNPFIYIFDNYLHEQGNPNLKASLSDNIELSFVLKNKVNMSLFFLHVKDPITKSFHLTENDRMLIYPDNLSSGYTYGLRMNTTTFKPTVWWQLNANLSLNYRKYKWFFFDNPEKVSVFTPVIGLNNQFEFAKSWMTEISMSFRGKTKDGQYTFKPLFRTYAGIRKHILKGNGTISLTVDDVFQSGLIRGRIKMPGQYYVSREREQGRLFHISFSYRFKQGRGAKESNRKRGIDESNRI